MPKEKDIIVIIVTPEEKQEETYKQPSADWYFIDALGNTVYLKHKDKEKCNKWVEENYGKGKYTLKPTKLKSAKGELSCRGFSNSKSSAGTRYKNICAGQGR